MGRMYREGLILLVPCGSCLKATNIGTMAKFGLSVTTNYFVVLGLLQKGLVLLFSSLSSDGNLIMM
jgi:hypothetical protein